jgi:hypothetical protein
MLYENRCGGTILIIIMVGIGGDGAFVGPGAIGTGHTVPTATEMLDLSPPFESKAPLVDRHGRFPECGRDGTNGHRTTHLETIDYRLIELQSWLCHPIRYPSSWVNIKTL